MRPKLRKLLWIAPLALLGMSFFVAFGGAVVMALWNWLLPPLLGWRAVTFWQALGLLALCRILFGGLGLHGCGGSGRGRRWAERWAALTPEERERFRQGLRGHRGLESPGESRMP